VIRVNTVIGNVTHQLTAQDFLFVL